MGARYGQKRKLPYPTGKRLRLALAALNLPDGTTKPYRPMPADFEEVYVRMGWDGLDEHYRTNWRVIRRWIEIAGRDRLVRLRAEHVEAQRAERRKVRRRASC